jgi:hypothetical protein
MRDSLNLLLCLMFIAAFDHPSERNDYISGRKCPMNEIDLDLAHVLEQRLFISRGKPYSFGE